MNGPASLGGHGSSRDCRAAARLRTFEGGSGGDVRQQIDLDHEGRLARKSCCHGWPSTGGHEPTEPLSAYARGTVRRCATTAFVNPLRPWLGTVSGTTVGAAAGARMSDETHAQANES